MTATDHTLFPFRNRLTQGVSINARWFGDPKLQNPDILPERWIKVSV